MTHFFGENVAAAHFDVVRKLFGGPFGGVRTGNSFHASPHLVDGAAVVKFAEVEVQGAAR